MKSNLFFLLIIGMTITSCNIDPCINKSFFIQQFESTTAEVFENHKSYNDKEWEKKDEKMDAYVGDCYVKFEEKLSSEEKKEFWVKYFKYKYYRHGKNVLKAIEEDAKTFSIEMDKELEELFDNPEQDVKLILRELYGEDLNETIDEFVKGIQNLGEKLKEWLNEK